MKPQPKWFRVLCDRLYERSAADDWDGATDIVLDVIGDMLRAGQYKRCNLFLEEVDVSRLHPSVWCMVMLVTLNDAGSLPARDGFRRRHMACFNSLPADQRERILKDAAA